MCPAWKRGRAGRAIAKKEGEDSAALSSIRGRKVYLSYGEKRRRKKARGVRAGPKRGPPPPPVESGVVSVTLTSTRPKKGKAGHSLSLTLVRKKESGERRRVFQQNLEKKEKKKREEEKISDGSTRRRGERERGKTRDSAREGRGCHCRTTRGKGGEVTSCFISKGKEGKTSCRLNDNTKRRKEERGHATARSPKKEGKRALPETGRRNVSLHRRNRKGMQGARRTKGRAQSKKEEPTLRRREIDLLIFGRKKTSRFKWKGVVLDINLEKVGSLYGKKKKNVREHLALKKRKKRLDYLQEEEK